MGSHFQGKDAVMHVAEAHARGIIASSEIHGTEIPGSLSAATDGAKETAVVCLLIDLFAVKLQWPVFDLLLCLIFFFFGWLIWKVGRSAFLGWSRLERLHRILEEEKWEIEHNRQEEREELKVLYQAKGFQRKLLEDVLDVLMADGDRLLKVMIEEELGLLLGVHEHPLKQSWGAGLGVFLTFFVCFLGLLIGQEWGLFAASLVVFFTSSAVAARFEGNQIIGAVVWNIAIFFLSLGAAWFSFSWLEMLLQRADGTFF